MVLDEPAVADMKRETKRSQELRHHHIVSVYDFVSDEQSACIAMEYVDGPTLSAIRARSDRGFLEVDEIKEWVEQLCEALAYAHQRARVVHRDLKPANLMVNSKNELKITDFGIARSVSDSVSMLTNARGTSGTLVYMSPQQLAGQRASHLDDIYSVGVSIYELLTGKPPFYSGDVSDQVKHVNPVSMQQRRKELELSGGQISKEWEETVSACLQKNSALRPQSVGEMARRLGLNAPWYGQTEPSALSSPAKQDPARKKVSQGDRRKPPNSLLVATLLILLGCGTLAGWWFGVEQPKRRARREAEMQQQGQQAEARAAVEKHRFDDQVAATAAAQVADEKRKAEEVAERQRLEREKKAATEAEAERARLVAEQQRRDEEAKKVAPGSLAGGTKEHPYENSLGMKFVPVAGTNVLFSIWETRVKDFAAFVDAMSYDASGGMLSLESGKEWGRAGRTWRDPGFSQTSEHAVCGVSWKDATAFCEWLTETERKAKGISANQSYRLPTDAEWSAAVGLEQEGGITPEAKNGKVKREYPWGTSFPPPSGAGNYGGSEARTGGWASDWKTIPGYRDGYPRTSPVGSFLPNRHGIYDLGGNVWEWCEDWYSAKHNSRVERGASWFARSSDTLLSSARRGDAPDLRFDDRGFRCVLAEESSR
jgi:formylglycine-generating enzyme required for sulfatase activity